MANGLVPGDDDNLSPPLEATKHKRPSVYWSVVHHKDIEDTRPTHSRIPHNEGEPLLQGVARSEASYDLSFPDAPYVNNSKTVSPGWERIREMVRTKELLIHHIPDLENPKSNDLKAEKSQLMKWSDLGDEYQYEYSLRECFFLTLFLLAIGVLGFSLLVEEWSILDSLYFTIIMLCTIGYGDMAPSTPAGKIFTSLFALGGIVVLGLALGVVGSQLVEAEVRAAEKAQEKTSKSIERAFMHKRRGSSSSSSGSTTSCSSIDRPDSVTAHNVDENDILEAIRLVQQSENSYASKIGFCAKEVAKKCLSTICMFRKYMSSVVPIFSGALIIAYLEGWPWYDAFYYTVITATTIGLGDLTPTREFTKACAVIFIPFAVAAMGYILGQCASFLVQLRREDHEKKLWACNLKLEDIHALDTNHEGGVNELEYIKFMLVAMRKVDAHLFDELHDQFKQLDVTKSGLVTKRDLQLIVERKLRKASYKLELSAYKHKLSSKSQRRSMMHSALNLMTSSMRLSSMKCTSAGTQSNAASTT
eukprot:CAMPEP_0201724274 /NCGR_PEP_ID=MMETSP0593-20130828/8078_1 /ASSEMBLY_ACC=CAM_ASM_000672 /TAXON_ID=267983 /ORGANISM="Skeletonema japonicum, Strain CCMP2506" /LENGTH=531 /DNA_ID=CAMNT_0048215513 /DNA_START=88 /DNA_END=1683 /DNA_ORIENTATION=-